MPNAYKVLIGTGYPIGYNTAITKDGHRIATISTWTRRGARREARRVIKKRQTKPTIEFVEYH
jgi:hypothetical protein